MRYYKTKWAAYKARGEGEVAIQNGSRWVVLTEAEHESYRAFLNQKKKREKINQAQKSNG